MEANRQPSNEAAAAAMEAHSPKTKFLCARGVFTHGAPLSARRPHQRLAQEFPGGSEPSSSSREPGYARCRGGRFPCARTIRRPRASMERNWGDLQRRSKAVQKKKRRPRLGVHLYLAPRRKAKNPTGPSRWHSPRNLFRNTTTSTHADCGRARWVRGKGEAAAAAPHREPCRTTIRIMATRTMETPWTSAM